MLSIIYGTEQNNSSHYTTSQSILIILVSPVFLGRKVLVNLFHVLVIGITKSPYSIVYVDACGLVHDDIITNQFNVKIL